MKQVLLFLLLVYSYGVGAQSTISGKVLDEKGRSVKGVSISLENTIDGGTTDSNGVFSFTTDEKGPQVLVGTEVNHDPAELPLNIAGDIKDITFRMRTSRNKFEEVVITAGAFDASNDKTKTVLSTMDVVTTAGANADVVKAIQTLPGTQQQGTQAGLFVRGGDASEAAMIVDELVVQNAFFSGPPGVATRSRFSPFQFKGISFSSGGYSARYGQALSSVLELNTLDLAEKSTMNVGLNMAGVYVSGTKLWKRSSGDVALSYNNLAPFYGIASTNVDYEKVPEGINGSAKYAWKPNKDGIVKVMLNASSFASTTVVDNPDSAGSKLHYGIRNQYYSGTISYRQLWGNKWNFYTAAGYSYNQDKINLFTDDNAAVKIRNKDNRIQGRAELKYILNRRLNVLGGVELQHYTFEQRVDSGFALYSPEFTETSAAAYLEAEWAPLHRLTLRPGIRYEHSELLHQNAFAPRLAMALKTGTYSQVAFAGGVFYQNPDNLYLLYGYRPQFQEAIHYIANYQWSKADRTLRLEAYYKSYQQLVREHVSFFDPNQYRSYVAGMVDNSGDGYAKGIELFWRDRKSVKNLDYWLSYSYIDTRRLYKNFPVEATPTFIADHNFNLIAKYYIEKLQTQINMTYSYASGRPYYNPNNPDFLGDRTPDFHNLALNINYLTHVRKWFSVIYAGIDNVTNQHNVFGYRYSADGTRRMEIKPALYRSFFIGVNFSLTEFSKDEL